MYPKQPVLNHFLGSKGLADSLGGKVEETVNEKRELTPLVWFQSQLFKWLYLLLLHFLHLARKHLLRSSRTVNTIRFDTHHHTSPDLEIIMRVQPHDPRLVRLGHIREDHVHHRHEHAVPQRMSRIFDDWDNVDAVRSHINQVAPAAMRELHCIHSSFGAYDVGHMTDRGPTRSAQVEYLTPRPYEDFVQTSENTGGKFAAKGVPDSVFDFRRSVNFTVRRRYQAIFNRDTFFAVDRFARFEVSGDEEIFFAPSDEYAGVAMRFLEEFSMLKTIEDTERTMIVFAPPLAPIPPRPPLGAPRPPRPPPLGAPRPRPPPPLPPRSPKPPINRQYWPGAET